MRPTALIALAATAALAPASLRAQSCTTPSSGTTTTRKCTVAVSSGTWAVPKLGTLTLSSITDIAIPSPDGTTYGTTKAEAPALSRTATVTANAPWTLIVAPSTAPTCAYGVCWAATDLPGFSPYIHAEQDKPSYEFLVGTTYDPAAIGYKSMATQNSPTGKTVLLLNQPATASTVVTLNWAEVWSYFYDLPGTYTLPFFVTLTIP
jgi:hypothetical protein